MKIYFPVLPVLSQEEEAARDWLRQQFPQQACPLAIDSFLDHQLQFRPGDLLWCHKDQMKVWSNAELEKFIQQMTALFRNGGSALFSLTAVELPVQMGMEPVVPNRRFCTSWQAETGEHQIRGLIGNPQHPIFTPFYGGIFTWRPQAGEHFSGMIYTDNLQPQKSAIIAVERVYIGLNEQNAIAWEQSVENGILLCLGAYAYFAMEQSIYLTHLDRLFKSCFKYLTLGKMAQLKKNYFDRRSTSTFHLSDFDFHPRVMGFDITIPELPEHYQIDSPSDNFWDLAGRRTLVVGKENGGIDEIWFHPWRGFKDISWTLLRYGGEKQELANAASIEIYPDRIIRNHQYGDDKINEQIFCCLLKPAVVAQLQSSSAEPVHLLLRMYSDFRLMWPYRAGILDGISFQRSKQAIFLTDVKRNFLAAIVANFDFDSVEEINHLSNHQTEVGLELGLTLSHAQPIQLLFYGSDEGVENGLKQLSELLSELPVQIGVLQQHLWAIAAAGGEIITPDEEVNIALRWAKWKLDAFVADLPEMGKGLLAGYSATASGWFSGRPGYAWFFGRDSVWCALALLALAEYETVRVVLEHLIHFQEFTGKIFHEVTTSGVVHYDAADSTPLFLVLMGEYFNHIGDTDFIRRNWQAVVRAYRFCLSTDRDGDGLIENTDVGHGWIEGGKLYGAHVTLYLAAIWVRALQSLGGLADVVGDIQIAKECRDRNEQIKADFQSRFWQEEFGFLGHGLDKQGQLLTTLTVMPAVAILLGVVDPAKANPTLAKLDTAEFCCDWGVRMLSDQHPDFNPKGYHSGSIWPLFTGWLALADYQSGRSLQAWLHWQHQLPLIHSTARGCMPEVLCGDYYEYAGGCQHQAWSEAMVLLPFYRGLLGMKADLQNNHFEMAPQIPELWPCLQSRNLQLGNRKFHFDFHRNAELFSFKWELVAGDPLTLDFKFLYPATAQCRTVRFDGQSLTPQVDQSPNGETLCLDFKLEHTHEIAIEFQRFLRFVPQVYRPRLGQPSYGYTIVNELFAAGEYRVLLHGRSGADYEGRILAFGMKKLWISNAVLTETEMNEWLVVHFTMPKLAAPYQYFELKFGYEV